MLQGLDFVLKTAAWAAAPARSVPARTKPRYVVIHHAGFKPNSGGTMCGAQQLAKSIQRDHLNRGWIDSGHNFLVTVGGIAVEGRHGSVDAIEHGQCVRSAHAPGANDSPGIECEGQFSQMTMSQPQWEMLVGLVTRICVLTGISPDYIKGHRDFNATECPGNWLYGQLPRLRAEVKRRLVAPK